MILSSSRLAQLRAALHAEVKRPTDLVDEVQWLAEHCNGLEAERNHLDDQLSELVNAVGKAVAHGPDLGKELSELSNAFAPELAKRLAAAVSYFADERAHSPGDPPSTERDEARPSKST